MLAEMLLMSKMRSIDGNSTMNDNRTNQEFSIKQAMISKEEITLKQGNLTLDSILQDTMSHKSIENFESLNPDKILNTASSSSDNITSIDSSISNKVISFLPGGIEGEVNNLSMVKIEPGIQAMDIDLKRIRNTNKGKQIRIGRIKRLTIKEKKQRREAKRLAQRAAAAAAAALAKLPPPQMFEEETRMSATESNSRAQTPARTTSMY